jgi:hypothetical protein
VGEGTGFENSCALGPASRRPSTHYVFVFKACLSCLDISCCCVAQACLSSSELSWAEECTSYVQYYELRTNTCMHTPDTFSRHLQVETAQIIIVGVS